MHPNLPAIFVNYCHIKYVGADKLIHLRTVVYSIYGKNHRKRHLNNDAPNRKWQYTVIHSLSAKGK